MSPNGRCTRSTVYDSSSQKLWCPMRVKRSAAAAATSARRISRSLRGGTRRDVQPDVVDLRRHPLGHRLHVTGVQLAGKHLQVGPEADRADVVDRLGRPRRPLLEPRAHVLEARLLEPLARLLGSGEVPGPQPSVEVPRERVLGPGLIRRLEEALDVAGATVLRLQLTAGLERGVQELEEPRVVRDPMEDGVREGGIDGLWHGQLEQVLLQDGRAVAEGLPRVLDHRRSGIDGDHVVAFLEQQLGHPPAAAAGVEYEASGLHAPQHLRRPLLVHIRYAVVGTGVPVAGLAHSAVVTGPGRSRSRSYAAIASSCESVTPMSSSPFCRRCLISGSMSKAASPLPKRTTWSARSISPSPASISARTSSSRSATGSRPILVQFE